LGFLTSAGQIRSILALPARAILIRPDRDDDFQITGKRFRDLPYSRHDLSWR